MRWQYTTQQLRGNPRSLAFSLSFVILLFGQVQDQRYLMPGVSGDCDRLLSTRNFDRRACGCVVYMQTNSISALRQPLDHELFAFVYLGALSEFKIIARTAIAVGADIQDCGLR